jgi:hypothetical protein
MSDLPFIGRWKKKKPSPHQHSADRNGFSPVFMAREAHDMLPQGFMC